MLKKILLLVCILAGLTLNCFAQDLIIKKSGDEIKARVTKVGETEIEYRKFEQTDGPIYTIRKSEIFMIKYQDGTKDVFNQSNSGDNYQNQNNNPNSNNYQNQKNEPSTPNGTNPNNPGAEKWYPYRIFAAHIGTEGQGPFLYEEFGLNSGGKGRWGGGIIFGENFSSPLPGAINAGTGYDPAEYSSNGDFKFYGGNVNLYASYNISNRFSVQGGIGLGLYNNVTSLTDRYGGNYYSVGDIGADFSLYGGCQYLFHKYTSRSDFVFLGRLGFNTSPGALMLGIGFAY